ncbi:NADPH-dependent FMN reductase [Pseudonocardia sp. H11422]|uniref:NADPH-dependent FMN reductase n=1 Tax=Pseudonocardia sp. H11422 TaxID=2835866 RepID=UPI0020288F4F|nr:NAD(P)H-dependent oxidoreductase [Pseudonocardia sp. H11422]
MRYLGISGPVRSPSRTTTATRLVLEQVREAERGAEVELLDLGAHRIQLCDGRPLADYDDATRAAVEQVCRADGYVVGTSVYRAAYSGVLKNLLDILPADAMADKPAAMVATGGSRDHYLVLDYALRPVLAALRARVTARVLYADPGAMPDGEPSGEFRDAAVALASELVHAVQRA